MSFPPPSPQRYHSIDVRPSGDSDEAHIPADPFGSQTDLTGHQAAQQAARYPPERHAHFGNSASSIAQRYRANASGTQTPIASDDKHAGGSFQKLDEKKHTKNASTHMNRLSSFDMLSAAENFDTRNASEAHLKFADGDFVTTPVGRAYAYLLNLSIVTRWILYIIPIAGLLWIPGIIGLTAAPNAHIWHVKLIWWSIWLTVLWGGWWAALAFAMILPKILRWTIGLAAVSARHYIGWFEALTRYIALYAWALASWIAYQPLIRTKITDTDEAQFPGSGKILSVIAQILFGVMLCCAVLLAEKFAIQFIAWKFHERSYAGKCRVASTLPNMPLTTYFRPILDRIEEQKVNIKSLVILYANSSDLPDRTDTLKDGEPSKGPVVNPKKIFRNVLKGFRGVAEGATTALGNVASEITGSSTLQPSSPEAKVYTALASANKTRLLARRLFYSFRQEGASELTLGDIARFFPNIERARMAFQLFDKDDNGDATREEVELACLDVHRELLSLSASMKDIDSAVGRLDNILMSLYVVVAALIMAVSLDASFTNLLTGAGTLILGLSWLIGGAAGEILSSIIFLFIKHPYDIGDSVEISNETYTVKEIRLLSTIFIDKHGCFTQAPHSSLTSDFIRNHRRSGPESEPFEMDVAYDTTFEKIEELRAKMLAFVESRRRDFQPVFDISVLDLPGQEKMVLKADIKYKSNNHLGALKAKRRNMWICCLKQSMGEVGIFGPSGNPNAASGPTQYTLVPWEEVNQPNKSPAEGGGGTIREPLIPRTDFNLADKNAALKDSADDIWGEGSELNLTNPKQMPTRPTVLPSSSTGPRNRSRANTRRGTAEEYEMRPGGPGGPQ
ncbi:hypothetical protein FS837_004683 [Tulasnella sp. UAMH 9824]|nr:hypothetical protein FS837_004683 [Tulasnella sp. UAMH 9824]